MPCVVRVCADEGESARMYGLVDVWKGVSDGQCAGNTVTEFLE